MMMMAVRTMNMLNDDVTNLAYYNDPSRYNVEQEIAYYNHSSPLLQIAIAQKKEQKY